MSSALGRIFKLSASGDPCGVSCDRKGASVGPVALLKRKPGGQWRPRSIKALNAALSRHYDLPIDITSKMGGLATIAAALNVDNIIKAKIAAVQLGLPDIPAEPLRRCGVDQVIGFAFQLYDSGILAKTWDPEKHPRWPAGESDGGQFRPADSDDENQTDTTVDSEQVADDPAKFTECNERCSKLLERYRTYSWSNVNEFHYRQCMNECMALG